MIFAGFLSHFQRIKLKIVCKTSIVYFDRKANSETWNRRETCLEIDYFKCYLKILLFIQKTDY